jgi:plastocyanin
LFSALAFAQSNTSPNAEFHATIRVSAPSGKGHAPAAVVWLVPVDPVTARSADPGHFTLVQKNRMFSPHLLVVPVGSAVSFPNEDPFFHNVFSLFNGKRFDLGLYETGASKEVVFSREGVSYIFCNIHPEMSAVIVTLSTSLYGIADASERVSVRNVPEGEYTLHAWIEGVTQPALDRLTRRIQIRTGSSNAVTLDATSAEREPAQHLNKYGQPYEKQPNHPY